uniref:Uncharacterized protein n=1 Tax=Mycena chlorophos TaxID=658473 RepID=A0ABQ0LMT4_MYCCL|nr:predicted protein [Mycena chlorophos]
MYHEQQREDSVNNTIGEVYYDDGWERSDPSHPFENPQAYDHFCRGVAGGFHRSYHTVHVRYEGAFFGTVQCHYALTNSDIELPNVSDLLPPPFHRFMESLSKNELARLQNYHLGLYTRLLDALPLLENFCSAALRLCALRDRRWGRDFLQRSLSVLELLSDMRYFVKSQMDLIVDINETRPAGPPLASDLDFMKFEVGAHIRDLAWQLCDGEDSDWSVYQPHLSSSLRIHHHRTPSGNDAAGKLQLPFVKELTSYDVALAVSVLEDLGVLLEVLVPNLDMLLRYQLRYYRWSMIAIELGTAAVVVIDRVGTLQEDISELTSVMDAEKKSRKAILEDSMKQLLLPEVAALS